MNAAELLAPGEARAMSAALAIVPAPAPPKPRQRRRRAPRSYRVEDHAPEDAAAGEAALAEWLRELRVPGCGSVPIHDHTPSPVRRAGPSQQRRAG